ncbi:MAG: hypothetical protein JXB04_02130 [Kiritimatiellae bacterium]|nr:hypothetical protein [Kiritimatiellia bacterium]
MTEQAGKVFGIGWAKTGTTTLGTCFEILGLSHKGTALDLVYNCRDGNLQPVFDIADKYKSFEDWPWILLYKEMDKRYPHSKFILTVRDAQKWRNSYLRMLRHARPRKDIKEIRKIIYGFEDMAGHEEEYVQRYERHNREVLEYFKDRPDDLLVVNWEKGDGWEKLCAFLGRSIPEVSFPHRNKGRWLDTKLRFITRRLKAVFRRMPLV